MSGRPLLAPGRACSWCNLPVTDSLPGYPRAIPHGDAGAAKPPGVVQAAAILTWIGAAAFDAFESGPSNPRWWLIGLAAVSLALCAAAAFLARRVWRGDRWAWWGLVVLSAVAALGGVLTAYAVLPLLVAGLATATFVLLLLSDSRAWVGTAN
jgi:hypothetical protein